MGSKHWIDYEQTCHPASDEESSWSCDKLNNKPPTLEGQNHRIAAFLAMALGWFIKHWVYHIGKITIRKTQHEFGSEKLCEIATSTG